MRYLSYMSEYCISTSKSHGMLNEVKRLAEKVEKDQSISSWNEYLPEPIKTKCLGTFRLLATQKTLDNNIIICFMGLYPRGSKDYNERFLQNKKGFVQKLEPKEDLLKKFLSERINEGIEIPEIIEPPEIEWKYLLGLNIDDLDVTHGIVFESHDWVREINNDKNKELLPRYYDLISSQILCSKGEINLISSEQKKVQILFKKFPAYNYTFLIAPINTPNPNDLIEDYKKNYKYLLNLKENEINISDLLKRSGRSYPALVLADDEQTWYDIEKNAEGNLALSPEESEIIKEITKPEDIGLRYPLFINGRPGSGKSTILQYLFAEYLFLHLVKEKEDRLPEPPIYLTYSNKLLDVAKTVVKIVLKCNSKFLNYDKKLDFNQPEIIDILERSFGEYQKFISQFLPAEFLNQYNPDKFINFNKFRFELNKKYDFKNKIPDFSPELAWHVIRTFIKGMSPKMNEYMDALDYKELGDHHKTVTENTYSKIYEFVWEKWYKPLCKDNNYWDSQDLTRAILDNVDMNEIAKFPAVFCDEAQDFTRNELELIFNLNIFSRRKIDSNLLTRVPFAFAGDPFQTLNPTGFNWEMVKANFHEKIIKNIERIPSGKLDMNYRELYFNYRSSKNIVLFSNLLQLLRGLLFGITSLKPQKVWFGEDSNKNFSKDTFNDKNPLPQYFNIKNENCLKSLKEDPNAIIILPCQEGEEKEYVEKDEILSNLVSNKDISSRNFLSPMQVKGLEFRSIILYKFGEDLYLNYPNLLDPLSTKKYHKGEAALPLEYYLNRLYVAATRAKSSLMIIDTDDGISKLWENQDIFKFDKLVNRYNEISQESWSPDYLCLLEPGVDFKSSENPSENAESFKSAGISERDSYKMRLAAQNFRRGNNETEAKYCEALAFKYDDNLNEAGVIFSFIGRKDDALECFWQSGSFENIVKDSKYNNSIYQEAAIFTTLSKKEKPTFKQCSTILFKIFQRYKDKEKIFQEPYFNQWQNICEEILNSFYNLNDINNEEPIRWREVFDKLAFLEENRLISKQSKSYADIAFKGERYNEAIKIWDTNTQIKTKNYFLAKAAMSDFPENIDWFFKADEISKAAEILKYKDSIQLSEDNLKKLFNYYMDIADFKGAAQLLEKNYDYKLMLDFYNKMKDLKEIEVTKKILEKLIPDAIKNRKWDDVMGIYDANSLKKEITDDANKILITQIAMLDSSIDAPNKTKEKFSSYLRKVLVDSKWSNIVNIVTAGSAIEKANKILDALDFYELIWSKNKIQATSRELTFARERWLKRKMMFAKLGPEISKKHLREIDERIEEWGFVIDLDKLPDYPNLDYKETGFYKGKLDLGLDENQKEVILSMQEKMDISSLSKVLHLEPVVISEFLKKAKK